ncbi:acyl carrier protein [Hymenobacter norwichensis]|uniref:acyl carrier protein n=1 Tax=Hymenobacter norwichensis TaxID=223903 RepID=UPI00041715A2
MGLDTVELVIAFEEYFQLAIPDQEAEKLNTVGEVAACVTQFKGLSTDPARTAAYYMVLAKLLGCLQAVHQNPTEDTLLAALWPPGTANQTTALATCLQLEVPALPSLGPPKQPKRTTWLQRLFGPDYLAPHPSDWSACTVADLADWILAQNYANLLPAPATLYEVQRATIGITSYCGGIDVPEIQLTDSFTNDLGMD